MGQAKDIIRKYHAAYPSLRMWHQKVQNTLQQNRKTVSNVYNRQRKYLGLWGIQLFHQAYAWINQSTVADHINEYGFLYLYERQDLFKEVTILNQVHDSVVYQIPLEVGWGRISEIISTVKQSMERPITWEDRTIVIPTDTTIYTHNFHDGIDLPDLSASTIEAMYKGS